MVINGCRPADLADPADGPPLKHLLCASVIGVSGACLIIAGLWALRDAPSAAAPLAAARQERPNDFPTSASPSRFDPAWLTQAAIPPDRPGTVPETRWLEYDFSQSLEPRTYRAGPLKLTISAEPVKSLPMVVQKVEIAAPGMRPHTMFGEWEPPGKRLRLAVLKLEAGAKNPAVLLQAYSGGFQCCNHVQIALPEGKGFRTLNLGDEWHGVSIPYPVDHDGDGRPELVFPDRTTVFHFTTQEYDVPPPAIINIVGGGAVNVSADRRFRPLFLAKMAEAEKLCRDPDPPTSAGACPGFVASAARAGRLEAAWRVMLKAHKPDPNYPLPRTCEDGRVGFCEDGRPFTSYPAALEALLKQSGYVPKAWRPPV